MPRPNRFVMEIANIKFLDFQIVVTDEHILVITIEEQ